MISMSPFLRFAIAVAVVAVATTHASTASSSSASSSASPEKTTFATKPNVLVLFADDMGVADLGVLGHPTISSPNLDKIANGGVRFTAWYSGFHICSPSRAAMMTGRLCVRSGTCGKGYLGGVFSSHPVGGLPTNETTFATALQGAGYTTAAIGKWHLGTKDKFMPTAHGFDHYFGIPFSVDMGLSAWSPGGEFPPLPLVANTQVMEQPVNLDTLSIRYANFATTFIKNATDANTPFLLYFAFNHVHTPDFVSPPFCGTSERGLFGDAVAELDWVVGQVMTAVKAAAQINNTIVFFSSDNGPWTSHALLGGSAGPFRDGKGSVWEGGVREPGFVNWPGTISARIENEPVATYDIFPTILNLAGVTLPTDRVFDGRDMMPLLLNVVNTSAHKCIFYWKGCTNDRFCGISQDSPLENKHTPGLWAVRCGSYKTHFMATNESCSVRYMPPGFYQSRPLIYRINEDPSERFPLTVADEEEYQTQLTIATAAVKEHMHSLTPALNQIALGLDSVIIQKGGAAFCGCPNKPPGGPGHKMKCFCDPQNMDVFVCKGNKTTSVGGQNRDVLSVSSLPSTSSWVSSPLSASSSSSSISSASSSSSSLSSPSSSTSSLSNNQPSSSSSSSSSAPNVVVLFVDDSGYGDYGVYGAPTTDTPNVNAMAAQGARFTQWYTAHAICTPSRAALMTGRLPIRYGLASTSTGGQAVFGCRADLGLPKNETTIANLLKTKGYATYMLGKWHLGATKDTLPTSHGFDSYYGIPYSVDMGFAYNNRTEESWSEGAYYGCTPLPLVHSSVSSSGTGSINVTVVEQPCNLGTLNQRYTDSAVGFIQQSIANSSKFFLYFAFGHVHTPQFAGVATAGKSKRGIFGDSVAEVDTSIGAVLKAIGDSNTLVLMSSDNGAPDAHQHLQTGQTIHAITGSNSMFLGSKTQTWEGGVRVPGIIWWPSMISPQVQRATVSTMDMFATIADAVNVEMPTDRVYDSVSLLPLMTGTTTTPPRNMSFFYAGSRLQAVRVGQYKAHLFTEMPNEGHAGPERGFLINSRNDHSPYGVQTPMLLFDIEQDPSEMYPINKVDGVDIRAMITTVIDAHTKQLGTPPVGVLDSNCETTDCRVCCDETKNCVCNGPPNSESLEISDRFSFMQV